MEILFAVIAGVVWGGAWGLLKYRLLWRPLFRADATANRAGAAFGLSLLADAAALLRPFFARGLLPFPVTPCLIAAAVALSVVGRWPVLLRARRQQAAEDPDGAGEEDGPEA